MEKIFKIGSFCFKLIYAKEIKIPKNFMLFEVNEGIPEYTYELSVADNLPMPKGKVIAKRADISIYHQGDLESRWLGIKGMREYYACYQEQAKDFAKVIIRMDIIKELNIDPMFSSLLALERRMLVHDSLILHCAYLRYQGKAILFSAPSGVGKSTQANLWETYQEAKQINGDRALLQKNNSNWLASGWPVCGTSGICENISTPIAAIVMLSQSTKNQVRKMTGLEAVRSLYTQTTVNYWDVDVVNKSFDLLEDIATNIPVYHLACDISKDAVNCLKKALEK